MLNGQTLTWVVRMEVDNISGHPRGRDQSTKDATSCNVANNLHLFTTFQSRHFLEFHSSSFTGSCSLVFVRHFLAYDVPFLPAHHPPPSCIGMGSGTCVCPSSTAQWHRCGFTRCWLSCFSSLTNLTMGNLLISIH